MTDVGSFCSPSRKPTLPSPSPKHAYFPLKLSRETKRLERPTIWHQTYLGNTREGTLFMTRTYLRNSLSTCATHLLVPDVVYLEVYKISREDISREFLNVRFQEIRLILRTSTISVYGSRPKVTPVATCFWVAARTLGTTVLWAFNVDCHATI